MAVTTLGKSPPGARVNIEVDMLAKHVRKLIVRIMPPIRQTQSYLRSLFAENGISPQRRLGQNFLIDLNIHDLIVKTAELDAGDVILEIGPGAGALTSLTAPGVAAVVAVEVDPAMARLTARATAGFGNVRVLNLDALAGKNTINPVVLDQVRSGACRQGTDDDSSSLQTCRIMSRRR